MNWSKKVKKSIDVKTETSNLLIEQMNIDRKGNKRKIYSLYCKQTIINTS